MQAMPCVPTHSELRGQSSQSYLGDKPKGQSFSQTCQKSFSHTRQRQSEYNLSIVFIMLLLYCLSFFLFFCNNVLN